MKGLKADGSADRFSKPSFSNQGYEGESGLNNADYIASGLEQFKTSSFGRFVMVFLGIGLILYGTYAVLAGLYYKFSPTEPPSRIKVLRRSMGLEKNEEEAEGKMADWKARFKNWRGSKKNGSQPSGTTGTGTPGAVQEV